MNEPARNPHNSYMRAKETGFCNWETVENSLGSFTEMTIHSYRLVALAGCQRFIRSSQQSVHHAFRHITKYKTGHLNNKGASWVLYIEFKVLLSVIDPSAVWQERAEIEEVCQVYVHPLTSYYCIHCISDSRRPMPQAPYLNGWISCGF